MWNFHTILTFFSIKEKIKAARSHARQLTHNNILRNASHWINFSMTCCIHQHIDSFLKRASHKCTSILSIDSMTSDSHQVTFCCHDVTKQCKMTIIDVKTVELQNCIHFLLNRLTNGFNSKHAKDLTNVVTECSNRINITFTKNFHKRCSVSFQKPFANSLKFTIFGDDNSLLCISLWKLKRRKLLIK